MIFSGPAIAAECALLPVAWRDGGLTLAMAESRLSNCNRDVIAARRAVEAAEADRITAGQRPNPNLTIGASNINPRAGVGSGPLRDKTFDQSVRLDQLVERGAKGALRERQGDALIAAARADFQDMLRQQRMLLRTAFFELAFQQARTQLTRDFATLARGSMAAAEKRLAVGDLAPNEANRFRLDAARAENDVKLAEADLKRARADFSRAIGAETDVADLKVVLPAMESLEVDARAEIERRPDVVAGARRVDAALIARDLARAIATRDVTVGAQFDRWPTSDMNSQGTGNSYSLSISIPLFVRHANEGEAQRAAVDLDAARDLLARLTAQARVDAQVSADAWVAARERIVRVEGEVLPLARDVAKSAEFAYSKGATGVLDLLDARRNLKQAELDAAQARSDAGKAWAQYAASVEIFNGSGS
jgi:cobalt-zinc-cadmium efflux system outer membrane protein